MKKVVAKRRRSKTQAVTDYGPRISRRTPTVSVSVHVSTHECAFELCEPSAESVIEAGRKKDELASVQSAEAEL